jgi:Family of unknown function (DUF5985)
MTLAAATYILWVLAAMGCAILLTRGYRASGTRLLFWSALCFWGQSLANALTFIDLVIVPERDLYWMRLAAGLSSLAVLLYGMCGSHGDMGIERLAPFVLGAMAMGCAVASLFFARFFRDTRDALFLYFSAAFGLEAVNRTLLAFSPTPNEASPGLYALRAFAYSLILFGIYRKNRR